MRFSENDIQELKNEVKRRLSEKRYNHTLGVLASAEKLAELCSPDYLSQLQAAALLHDITKEFTEDEHYALLAEYGIFIPESERPAATILHSITAPLMISRDFAKYATNTVMSATRNHTTGFPDMSINDKIIFLADFIEDNRTYPDSVALRSFVFQNMRDGQFDSNSKVLTEACLRAIESTINHLNASDKNIDPITLETKTALTKEIQNFRIEN